MEGTPAMFVTIDGPDGTGKTTVAQALVQRLKARGIPCVFTAEPTDTALGLEIRALLKSGEVSPAEMTELFVRDRDAHVKQFLLPHLRAGETVVCDRYKYSTVCYQHLQGEPLERLLALNGAFPAPDLSVVLTVKDVGLLLERIGLRGGGKDFFETEAVLEQAIALYREMERFYPQERFLYLDAGQPPEASLTAILERLDKEAPWANALKA